MFTNSGEYIQPIKTEINFFYVDWHIFANRTSDSVWETLAQLRKVARISALFKTYSGERA
jgi:hypothetical protein